MWAGLALLFLATSGRSAQAPAGPQENPPPPQQSAPAPPPPSAASAVKVETRLITVDVVATDSHGHAVRDLKQSDFQIFEEHGGQDKIARFTFIDAASGAPPPGVTQAGITPHAPHVLSNMALPELRVPPTVILLDALNTDIANQSEVHRHMLLLLKTLPANTPIAVFVLGHTLHVVQNFTTDPGLLKTAVDQSLRSITIANDPRDDSQSASSMILSQNGGEQTAETQALEDFEKEEYAEQTTIRVDETSDAMIGLAKYLGGYPGRKNLIWFSGSFPLWIEPTPSTGKIPSQEFLGSADNSDQTRAAAEALTDAQVAVYPVDAKGLEVSQLYSVQQDPRMDRRNPGASLGDDLNRDTGERIENQASLKVIAESTGGRVCINTNDLSGCVETALNDGASYYELSYYPEDIKWDGHFQKITVKTERHGVHLAYRRGYFATSFDARAHREKPEQLLDEACNDPLPSTAIGLTVEPIAPALHGGEAGPPRYLLTVSPTALTLGAPGPTSQLNLQMAICEYNAQGDHFSFFPRDISQHETDAALKSWQEHGIRGLFDFDAKPENPRLRFAVLDVRSGTTGSVDVPAHPTDFGVLPVSAGPTSARGGGAESPAARPQQEMVTTALTFKSNLGHTSTLDWSEGKVTYQGDLGVELGASGFFQKFFAGKYHCQAGSLISNDPNSTTAPRLALLLRGLTGSEVLVDFTGSEPQYTGQLPVNPDARAFFEQVWKLCHCQAQ
jgi:VWFA-related protein